MFATLGRSWEYTKVSYGIIWDFKKLMIFPLVSIVASLAVLASFILPLWASGTLETWMQFVSDESAAAATTGDKAMMYITLFLLYFCSYFVITFFNSALIACAMKVVSGEEPTIGYGFAMAGKRLPQILAWALLSAVIGVLLKMVENASEKAGRIVAMILGSAWTALTYFVVPVLVMEGVGPFSAIKSSLGTLKKTWGEALIGQFTLGFLAFLVTLPVFLIIIVLGIFAGMGGNMTGVIGAIIAGVILLLLVSAFTSAADVVFKALLYNYATGKTIPTDVDASVFGDAFAGKG